MSKPGTLMRAMKAGLKLSQLSVKGSTKAASSVGTKPASGNWMARLPVKASKMDLLETPAICK